MIKTISIIDQKKKENDGVDRLQENSEVKEFNNNNDIPYSKFNEVRKPKKDIKEHISGNEDYIAKNDDDDDEELVKNSEEFDDIEEIKENMNRKKNYKEENDYDIDSKKENPKKRTFNQRELDGFYESSGFIPFRGEITNLNKKRKYND